MKKKTMRVLAIATVFLMFVPTVVMAAAPHIGTQTNDLSATYDEFGTEVSASKEVIATEDIVTIAEKATEKPDETDDTKYLNLEVIHPPNIMVSTSDEYNNYHYDLLARAIYQEAGSCGEHCQWLVGSAILNLADERGGIENVVFDYNTINVAYVLYDDTPSELSYWVAKQLLSGHRDYNVKYFRSEYYHSFGTPYTNVDNIYFSTS